MPQIVARLMPSALDLLMSASNNNRNRDIIKTLTFGVFPALGIAVHSSIILKVAGMSGSTAMK